MSHRWRVRRRWKVMLPLLLVLTVSMLGCAKRPLSTSARESSVAPAGLDGGAAGGSGGSTGAPRTGGAGTSAAQGADSRGGAAGGGAGEGGQAGAGVGAGATAGVARPDPRQFAALPRLRDIHFEFDQYSIRPDDAKILDANVDWLISNPNYLVLVEGHCDERGTNQYNIALGEHRARAAMNYLVARGVQAERITTLSYGKERPACIARTDTCWAMNRRAHFLVKAAGPRR